MIWSHDYSFKISEAIKIPSDFEIKESFCKWGRLTLIGKDGKELTFESDLNYGVDFKRPDEFSVVEPL